jgi:hypothetical protein
MTALTLVLLLGASAIAVDLAALRTDRSADQKVTDSAASAGALAAIEGGGGQEACEAALAYIAVNSEEISSIDATGCAASFSSSCDPAVTESHTVTTGRFSATVVYPVPDNHPLMSSGLMGAPTQTVVAEDGDPCSRVGVEVSADRQGLFAQVLGWDQGTTTVHTVAISDLPSGDGVPLNLLVLDRTGCQAIDAQGNGGIVVRAVVNEDGTGLIQGVAASDSDASAGCTTDGVIDVDGSNAVLRADGPEGCSNQTGTGSVDGFTSGDGCGLVQTFVPPGPGCVLPACSGNPGNPHPNPDPTALPGRLTRAPIDHRYNCWSDYTSPPAGSSWATDPLIGNQDIPGCTGGTPDHIYDLINSVGSSGSAGYTDWTTLGHPCDVPSSGPDIVVNTNVRVDCATLTVRKTVTITGNVIFDGNVIVEGGTGNFTIDNTLAAPGWAFFRNGLFSKAGRANVRINYTMVYLSKTSRLAMAGSGNETEGILTWIAPNSGDFDDLALWSDSPLVHDWAGQANLTMEGVFFMPLATADYSGTGGQNQTDAQWIAHRLVARGQGQLEIQPAFGRAVEFPSVARTTLIR